MDAHRQRQRALGVLLAALLAPAISCGGSTAPTTPAPTVATAKPAAAPAFIDDDYARALAEAKEKKKPIFVDAWAPWCHSCLSMRAYVLSDPALAPLANDLVWLAIDTEKDSNGAFTSKFQNRVWPTLWLVDPATETATMRWEGTATTSELLTLLAAVQPHRGAPDAKKKNDDFRRGTELLAKGEVAEAERAFARAMDDDDATRPQAVEALVGLVAARKDHKVCSTLAATLGPSLPVGTSRATVLATGLGCARDAKRDAELALLVEAAEKSARDPDPRMAADDRSALYEELVETKKEKGDATGAKTLAKEWAGFLEGEAKKAPSKSARAVFDAHRLSAYLAAEEPARAVPMLQESERDFPDDYNPPARLAKAYLTMKQLDDARAAIDRAAARVYGPRSLRVFSLSADIAKAKGDVGAERAALEQAIARTKTGPAMNDNQKKLRADLEKRLGALR